MRALRPLTLSVVLLASLDAYASGLQVAPTSLELSATQNADGLWLSNTGDAALHAQVRVYHWTQEGGEDKLTPSRALAISPPMLALGAEAKQLVRVIRAGAPPAANEDAYRVLIDELPVDDPSAAAAGTRTGGLQYVLRYSVPIFIEPAGAAGGPKLDGKVLHEGEQNFLQLTNQGNRHAQLGNLVLIDAKGQREELSPGLVGYVLPGQTMRWPLKLSADRIAAGGTLQSRINSEPVEQTLVVLAPAR